MHHDPKRHAVSRREFLNRGTGLAGILGIATAGPWSGAAAGRRSGASENPFAYDVSRFAQTDPKLVHYEEAGRFTSPRAEPKRLAIGPEDRLYVAGGQYVTAVDLDGLPLSEVALRGTASCLAVSSEGDLFVGVRDHVEVFDGKGQRRAAWDSAGPKSWLTGLAISGDEVFLADAGQRIVLRCDGSGKVLGRIGAKEQERNIPGFVVPSPFFDLKMHPDGLLRVGNPGRHRVEAYTVDGHLELAWGKPSAAIDGFCGCCNPINITLLPDGRTVTCEKGLPRVKVYREDGTFESVVAGTETFPENAKASRSLAEGKLGGLDAAVDSQGRIYILDPVTAIIRVMARKAGVPRAHAQPVHRNS